MGEAFPLRAVAHTLGISLGNCNTCIGENFPFRAVVYYTYVRQGVTMLFTENYNENIQKSIQVYEIVSQKK